jgi:Class II Aldolase and Adducin N-terminal domain
MAPPEPKMTQGGVEVQILKFPAPPKLTDKYKEREFLKGRLAVTFRIFGKLGFDEGVAGHVTLRDPVDPTTFWVNPFGLASSLIKASDLIRVVHDGAVVDGGSNRLLNLAAYMIHILFGAAPPLCNKFLGSDICLQPRHIISSLLSFVAPFDASACQSR